MAGIGSRPIAIGLLATALLVCVEARRAAAVVSLAVEMTALPNAIGPGGLLTYEIEVTNSGDESALGVAIQSAVPTDTTFFAASDGGAVVGGNNVEWSIGSLAGPGSKTVTLEVDVAFPAVSANSIVNAVLVTATNTGSASHGTLTPIQPLGVDISVGTAPPGCDGSLFRTYPIRFVNGALSSQTGVELTAEIPDGTTLDAAGLGTPRCSITQATSCTSASDCPGEVCELFWDLGTLASEEQGIRLFTVRVDDVELAGTTFNSSAAIRAGLGVSTDTSPTSTVADTPCPSVGKIDLSPVAVEPGGIIQYRITVLNVGRVTATGSELSDPLPAGTSFESADPGSCGGDAITGILGIDDVVRWDLDELDPEDQVSVCLELNVDPNTTATSIQNTATFTDLEGDLVADGETTDVVTVTALSLRKNAKPDPVEIGEKLTFTLTFENQANFLLEDVVITDDANDFTPSGCVSFDPDATAACGGDVPAVELGGVVTWELGSVAPAPVGSAQVCYVVNVNACGGELFRNIAVASDSRGEQTVGISKTRIQAPGVPIALRLFKQTPGQSKIKAGEDIVYTLRLQNRLEQNLSGVTLTDDVSAITPAGAVTFVSADSSECGGSGPNGVPSGDLVTWTFPTLAPGSETVCLRVNTSKALVQGTKVVNTAEALDPNGNTAEDSITMKIFAKPLHMRMADLDDPLPPGPPGSRQIRYEISVDNLGDIPLGPDPNVPPAEQKDVLIRTVAPLGTSLSCLTGSATAQPGSEDPYKCPTPADGVELVRDPFIEGGRRILWRLTEPLGPDESRLMEMVVTVIKDKKRTIRARVRAKDFTLRSKAKARALTVVERD